MLAWILKQRIRQTVRWLSWIHSTIRNATSMDTLWWQFRFFPKIFKFSSKSSHFSHILLTHHANSIFLRPEQITRLTIQQNLSSSLRVFNRTHEELILAEEIRENDTENHRGKSAADETFPSFFRAQLDQRSFSEEESEHISHNIIADYHHDGNNEPNHSLRGKLEKYLLKIKNNFKNSKKLELFYFLLNLNKFFFPIFCWFLGSLSRFLTYKI